MTSFEYDTNTFMGEDYVDLNEYFNRIKFPKDLMYVYMNW